MKVTVLSRHYDGEKKCPHAPCDLAPDTPLLISTLPDDAFQKEQEGWFATSKVELERAYVEDQAGYSDCVGQFPPE